MTVEAVLEAAELMEVVEATELAAMIYAHTQKLPPAAI
jgi:hypothetical protein